MVAGTIRTAVRELVVGFGGGGEAMALKVRREESALPLANLFKETNIPIVAVVDEEGKLVGTILEREILRRMVESLEG